MNGNIKDINDLTRQVIALAMKVHRTLGPGYLEKIYKNALSIELERTRIPFEIEKNLKVIYENEIIGEFRADIIIDNRLILELKAVNCLNLTHEVQLVNYLTTTGIEDGLLFNFGSDSLEWKRKFRKYRKPINGF